MTTIMGQKTLVFIPTPARGHLIASVDMAKMLINRDENLSITILLIKRPNYPALDSFLNSLATLHIQRLNFVQLPSAEPTAPLSFNIFMSKLVENHKDPVRHFVNGFLKSEKETKLAGFVIDMFCSGMIEVADEYGLPTYVFSTSGTAMLGLIFHLQTLRHEFNQDITRFKDSDQEAELSVSTYINKVPAKVLPSPALDKDGSDHFLNHAKGIKGTRGILVNSFLELEPEAVKSLFEDDNVPPIYPVGPILNVQEESAGDENEKNREILKWLDDQPHSSVVFLCFGTIGCFEAEQVKEIAHALEGSGYRFLWSLRQPPPKGVTGIPAEYENPEQVLPEGFLERTKGVGKIIGWAPQLAVLSHPAVGGFVSHCGWNSTLESVWCGVPMATWPQYAEQQMNAFQLVKDLGLAVEIQMDYRMGSSSLVKAQEIETKVKQLMDPNSEIRSKVKDMKEKSRMVLMEGGSSYNFLDNFLQDIKKNIS
ncbi:glycosyltransferase [Lithospermum erythrorhizon]|uniref:Glycosyltransferase n=1 Tax=Lithospermum erythrorhizon TaxID=34254 RepID=A0AAV3PHH6_LITER